jgi:hypothetical protein
VSLSTIIFAGLSWLWTLVGVLVVGAGLVAWNYLADARGPLRWVCASLRMLGLAALCLCLLRPLWSTQRARPGANLFAIVADNSQGMRIKDRGASISRGQSLRRLLNPDRGAWQSTLEDNFDVRRYYFDARLQSTRDFSDLDFNGRASAIGFSLRTLAERYKGRPLAGILLLTDGNATDLQGVSGLQGLPPVYPVVIGSQDPVKDIALQQVVTEQTEFEDAPVSVQADVSASGYGGQMIVAQLLDTHGKQVGEQRLRARKDKDQLAFRFRFRPEAPGLVFYRVNVRARNELGASSRPEDTREATLENNRAVAVINRGQGPYRILYVSGRPNWEFKFLNRAAQDDPQLQLVALIRVAKREPRFHFLGRPGETSNPLFRGFGNQAPEDVEQYDQPVLVRLNTRDQFELRGGFPSTPKELYQYKAVIAGDLEEAFFTPDQANLLQKYVSERGGGFLMLGGMESFEQGKYQNTPIGDMLPVYLDHPAPVKYTGPYRFDLTREGLLQPWARLRDNEKDEESRLREMTPFEVFNPVGEPKPGASVIGTVTDANGQKSPALVVQRFGRGRTAAMMVGDVWRWGFHDAAAHRDMDTAWRQLLRWLVTDVPNRVQLTAQPEPQNPNGAVRLHVRVMDPQFQPLDNATVHIRVQPVLPDATAGVLTNAADLRAEAAPDEPGLYTATYVPRIAGGYRATAWATNSAGAQVGSAEAGWATDLAAAEFQSLTPNVALLEAIARKTGGEVIPAGKLGAFARHLPRRHAPVMQAWSYPLWHTPLMFCFALVCFVSEWGLRRWKGMP